MWEETTIEQTPQHKTSKDSFSFSNMISKFSPFSPTSEDKNKNSSTNNGGGSWLSNKKNKVPGSITQTTSNRPSSPSPVHNGKKGKIIASEYFGNGVISTSTNIQDENVQNNTSPNTSPLSKSSTSYNNNNNNNNTSGLDFKNEEQIVKKDNRTLKFEEFLKAPFIEMDKLTKLTWNGISNKLRPIIWRILIGYTPVNKERRETTLERKRKEYTEFLDQYWYIKENERSEYEMSLYKQISIDVPRTNPTIKLFQQDAVQISLNKILYI